MEVNYSPLNDQKQIDVVSHSTEPAGNSQIGFVINKSELSMSRYWGNNKVFLFCGRREPLISIGPDCKAFFPLIVSANLFVRE